jgi:hypothetical protein
MVKPPALALAGGIALALLLAPAAARADSVVEQIQEGLAYYEEGDLAAAIEELEYAIGEIRGRLGGLFAGTLPEPPAGWVADAAESQGGAAFMGGGTIINRSYREEGGRGRIEAQLVVDNPMMQGFAALMSNPAMMAAQPNTQRVRVQRENAILRFEPDRGSGEITLILGGRAMAKLEGQGLASGDLLVELMEGWDLRQLKDLAGL